MERVEPEAQGDLARKLEAKADEVRAERAESFPAGEGDAEVPAEGKGGTDQGGSQPAYGQADALCAGHARAAGNQDEYCRCPTRAQTMSTASDRQTHVTPPPPHSLRSHRPPLRLSLFQILYFFIHDPTIHRSIDYSRILEISHSVHPYIRTCTIVVLFSSIYLYKY